MVLSRPPWPVFLIDFAKNQAWPKIRRWNVNNCVTRIATVE